MKKINLDSLNRINGRRLHLDTKQKKLTQHLTPKKEKTISYLNQKSQHLWLPRSKNIKKFPIKDESLSIIPYLMKIPNENPKSVTKLNKIRSQSQSIIRSTLKNIINQSLRFRISSKKIIIERKKTLQLQADDKRQIYQNATLTRIEFRQNGLNLCDQKQKIKSQNILNHTIFEQKPESIHEISSKAEKKEFLNVGVQTELQISDQSYKEFMRFKLALKQKYFKMQGIFKFIDEISQPQTVAIKQRYQQIKRLYQEPMNSSRQKQVSYLMKEVKKGEAAFLQYAESLVKDLVTTENTNYLKNLGEINQAKEQLSKFKKNYEKHSQLKQNDYSNDNYFNPLTLYNPNNHVQEKEKSSMQKKKKGSNLQADQIITTIMNKFTEMEHRVVKIHEQMQTKSYESQSELRKRLQSWQLALEQKSYVIHVCVEDVMQVPEISLSIFGMDINKDQAKESEIVRKIGVFLQDVPEFDSFFSKSLKKPELVFTQLLDYKCLNVHTQRLR